MQNWTLTKYRSIYLKPWKIYKYQTEINYVSQFKTNKILKDKTKKQIIKKNRKNQWKKILKSLGTRAEGSPRA